MTHQSRLSATAYGNSRERTSRGSRADKSCPDQFSCHFVTLDQSQDAEFGVKAALGCGVSDLPCPSSDNTSDDQLLGTHASSVSVKRKTTARLELIRALHSEEKVHIQQNLDAAFPCIPDLETFRSVLDNKT
ncbi:hypothetical protein BaRGS_00007933 [Batillaria attramentaria]|uniref:Uncharacterized protein n=1 Tax=Batillaria attramentaria TaxID=370345 RepID=A0ABD0LM69_9CAEN